MQPFLKGRKLMKIKVLFSLLVTAFIMASGFAVAGPEEKGKDKEKVTITHANSSESGAVLVEVSVSGATAHLLNHEFDCVESASNEELEEAMKSLEQSDCGGVVE